MYTALYRKYRPQTLNDVVGQDVIKRTLINAVKNNKLSHAYLFCGPRGTGKTSIAKLLGKIINCEAPVNDEPCNKCVFCTQYNNKQSTDIIEIDAASNNGVDEIREIRNKVNLVPTIGKYKIYIIDEVHMLTVGAFNALLKTLEEPPSHIMFILATTEPHKIPNTILSRCQRFDFKKISDDEIYSRLKFIIQTEKIESDDNALKEIARISQGGMRDAISILDQVIAYAEDNIKLSDVFEVNGLISEQEMSEFVIKIHENNIEYLFDCIKKYNNSGKNLIKVIEDIINFFRNVLLYKTAVEYSKEYLANVEIYAKISDLYNIDEILNTIKILNNSLQDMKNFNNPRLVFELAIIQLLNLRMPEKNKFKIENQHPVENYVEKSEGNENKIVKNNDFSTATVEKMKVDKLKEIRINNTLSQLNKRVVLKLKSQIDLLKPLLLEPKYSELISLILDGEIKAASEKYLIFVYNNNLMAHAFNNNIGNIESILSLKLDEKYRVIAVDIKEWEIIKNEFNLKLKKYEFIEEENNIVECTQKQNDIENDPMIAMFGDIVEYK